MQRPGDQFVPVDLTIVSLPTFVVAVGERSDSEGTDVRMVRAELGTVRTRLTPMPR